MAYLTPQTWCTKQSSICVAKQLPKRQRGVVRVLAAVQIGQKAPDFELPDQVLLYLKLLSWRVCTLADLAAHTALRSCKSGCRTILTDWQPFADGKAGEAEQISGTFRQASGEQGCC